MNNMIYNCKNINQIINKFDGQFFALHLTKLLTLGYCSLLKHKSYYDNNIVYSCFASLNSLLSCITHSYHITIGNQFFARINILIPC